MIKSETVLPKAGENVEQNETQPIPQLTFWRMITGAQIAQSIHVAVQLNIADHLVDGPLSVEELASRCGAHARSLYRLLRALASLGVFWEDEQRRFHLNEMAQVLRSDVPHSLHALIALCHTPSHWAACGNSLRSIQTGENAFEHLHKQSYWDYLNGHPHELGLCHKALSGLSSVEIQAIFEAYDFSPYHLIIDVAGGWGKLLSQILQANPNARGILFDLPLVAEKAAEQIRETEIGQRCSVEAGDMFVSVPRGGDLYMVKSVIHDWEDSDALTLLRNCRAAMKPGAKLLLIEQILAQRNVEDIGKFMDLFLLTIIGGQERMESEFRALVEQAGLVFERVIPTQSAMSIIECSKRSDDI